MHPQPHADHRPHPKVERLRGDHCAIPADLAPLLEAAHALQHGRSRQAQRLREMGVGLATVALQGDEDVAVE